MKYMKDLKWEMVIFSLGCIAVGVIMTFFPNDFTDILAIFLGVLMFFYAIRHTVEYFRRKDMNGFTGYELVFAVIFLVLGIVCLTQMDKLISLLAYFVAVIVLVSGLMKLENAFDLKRMGAKWIPMLIIALIFILLAVVFLIYPSQEGEDKGQTLIAASGIAFMFVGLVNLITTLAVSGKIKRWTRGQSPRVTDIDFDEEDDEDDI